MDSADVFNFDFFLKKTGNEKNSSVRIYQLDIDPEWWIMEKSNSWNKGHKKYYCWPVRNEI